MEVLIYFVVVVVVVLFNTSLVIFELAFTLHSSVFMYFSFCINVCTYCYKYCWDLQFLFY